MWRAGLDRRALQYDGMICSWPLATTCPRAAAFASFLVRTSARARGGAADRALRGWQARGRRASAVLDRAVRDEERAGTFLAAHHEFQQVLGSRRRELPDPEVVDDEQRYVRERCEEVLARAGRWSRRRSLRADVRRRGRAPESPTGSPRVRSPARDGSLPVPGGPRKSASSRR